MSLDLQERHLLQAGKRAAGMEEPHTILSCMCWVVFSQSCVTLAKPMVIYPPKRHNRIEKRTSFGLVMVIIRSARLLIP